MAAWAVRLGIPTLLVVAGGTLGSLFLLGDPIQKNLKAWRERLGLKPLARVTQPAPLPKPDISQTVLGNGNQSILQSRIAGNLSTASGGGVVHAETIGHDLVQRDQVQGD